MSIDRENYLLITTLFFTDSYSYSREALVPTPAETRSCSAPSDPRQHEKFAEQILCEKLNEHDGWRAARSSAPSRQLQSANNTDHTAGHGKGISTPTCRGV
jgi:hypothetical protein